MKGPGTLRDRSLIVRLGTGFGWNAVAAIFNQGSTFVVYVLLARLWSLERFGEFSIVYATILASSTLAQLSMGYTATRYLSETRKSDPGRAGRLLALTGGFAAVSAVLAAGTLLAASSWIASSVLRNAGLASAIAVGAAALALSVVNGFAMGALAGLEAFRRLAVSGAVAGVIFVAACWLGASRAGLIGSVIGLTIAFLAQTAVLYVQLRGEVVRQKIALDWRGGWGERRVLSSFSIPAALGGVVAMTALWFSNAILVRQSGGYEALALFTAANNWRLAVLFLPAILNPVSTSLLNAQRGDRDEVRYRRVFWLNLTLSLSVVCVAAVLALALGPLLLRVFGKAYVAGYPILAVLMGAAVAEASVVAIYQLIQSQSRLWLSLVAVILPRDAVIVGLAFLLCPRKGAVGLASAYAVGWLVALVGAVGLASRQGLALKAGGAALAGADRWHS